MSRLRIILDKVWDKVLVTCGVLIVSVPISPLIMSSLSRDSGVFLYIGWRILAGELPYRDVWDQKPPVIFYLNALGLAISKNSRWGVWLIESLALFLAAYIGFRLIKKTFGSLPALFSMIITMLTLNVVIVGGNLPEEYALPLQFAGLWLIKDGERLDFSPWRWFLIGLLGATAFFTKQTCIGIWIAIIMYLSFQRLTSGKVKRWLRECSMILLGALPVFIGIVIFFGVNGALPQFWSAAFQYNFIYSSAMGLAPKLKYIAAIGITTLAHLPTAIFYLSMIGYIVGLILVLFKKNLLGTGLPLLIIGLIDIPIELVLIGISGKNYPHYYISLLPVLSVFVGLMFWVVLSQLSTWSLPKVATYIFVIGIIGMIFWSSFRDYHSQITGYLKSSDDQVINYIKTATAPDDYVLFWGAESADNFMAQRRSPTRFVYQYPLYQPGYTGEQMINEFLEGVIRSRPKLIVDTNNPLTPMYRFPVQTTAITADIAYLQSHYRFKENIGSWSIYTFIESADYP